MYKDPSLENQYFAWLLIRNFDCSPEEITKQIGITPTEVNLKGQVRVIGKKDIKVKRMNKENTWILASKLSKGEPVEKHIDSLLSKLKPYKKNFRDIAKKYEIQFNCAVYYHEANPGIELNHSIIKELAALEIPLYFDIYCMAGTVSQFEQKDADKKLSKQLSKIKSVIKFNESEHNEPQVLANSLIEMDAAQRDLQMHMEDLVIWDEIDEKDYKEKLELVSKDLKRMLVAVKKSTSLKKLVNEI